jgi:hypothetical protein
MGVELPAWPGPRDLAFRLISKRRDLEPTFGGPTTRVQRLGSKWAADVTLPPLSYEDAMAWVAALTRAEGDTVILDLPQPDFQIGNPGDVRVNGANQQGLLLNLDGFNPYTAKAGQWFNLIIGGQRYLYQVAVDRTAAGGAMSPLQISPMIRRSPPDNALADFATPKIEGFLSGRETTWTIEVARTVGLQFTITERE